MRPDEGSTGIWPARVVKNIFVIFVCARVDYDMARCIKININAM